MHPLKLFMLKKLESQKYPGEYRDYRNWLIEQLDIADLSLYHIGNPNTGHKLSAARALKLELLTNGEVRAEDTARPDIKQILILTKELRERGLRS